MAAITYRYEADCGGFTVRRIDDGYTCFLSKRKPEAFVLLADTFGWEGEEWAANQCELEVAAEEWLRSNCGADGESGMVADDPTYFDHC